MAIDVKSKMREVRQRYGTIDAVFKKLLGQDADPSMLELERTSERGGRFDPRDHSGGGEIEGGHEARGVRREMSSEDRMPRARVGRDTDPPIEPPPPEQNRGDDWEMMNGDDERDEYSDFADYLRERGIAEDVIRGAVDYHRRRRGMDNRKSNGRDRFPQRRHGSPIADPDKEATDLLPRNEI